MENTASSIMAYKSRRPERGATRFYLGYLVRKRKIYKRAPSGKSEGMCQMAESKTSRAGRGAKEAETSLQELRERGQDAPACQSSPVVSTAKARSPLE